MEEKILQGKDVYNKGQLPWEPSSAEKMSTWDRSNWPPFTRERSNSGGARSGARYPWGSSRSKVEVGGGQSSSFLGMQSVDGRVIAPLALNEGFYSSERWWSASTSFQEPTLSMINRLQYTTSSEAWTRQPTTYHQSQLQALRPRSQDFRSPSSRPVNREFPRDRFPPICQEESGATRYHLSRHVDSRAFLGPLSGDYGILPRDPRSSSFHSDASFQAQDQNWDTGHRLFGSSAPVSTSSPSRGATGVEVCPPWNLPHPLTTRKPYGELLAKVLADLNLPSPPGWGSPTYGVSLGPC